MKYADRFGMVAQRLRARGFTVNEQPGWRTRGRRGEDFASIETVTIHHTATGGTADYASLGIVTNGRPDLAGPLCNWGVGRQGGIYLVAAGAANHTGATWKLRESNKYAVGIECENDGVGEAWGPSIYAAMVALTQELRQEFDVARDDVLGHKEICSPNGRKPDPAHFDMGRFRLDTDDTTPLEDFMATLTDAEKDEVMRAIRAVNRAIDTQLESKVDGSKLWLTDFIVWNNKIVTDIAKKLGI